MSNKSDLNPDAKEFVPYQTIDINEFFDKLEQDFMESNRWLFEEDTIVIGTVKVTIPPYSIPKMKIEIL